MSRWAPRSLAFPISVAALLIAIAALCWAVFHDPLGPGLRKYDFSTPRAALFSTSKMKVDNNVRAAIELEQLNAGGAESEKLKTLNAKWATSLEDTAFVFFSFESNGKPVRAVEAFCKHPATGYWLPARTWPSAIKNKDPALARQMENWVSQGVLSTDVPKTTGNAPPAVESPDKK
jgi:hypothetical protein